MVGMTVLAWLLVLVCSLGVPAAYLFGARIERERWVMMIEQERVRREHAHSE
jgi:hypothetical protein